MWHFADGDVTRTTTGVHEYLWSQGHSCQTQSDPTNPRSARRVTVSSRFVASIEKMDDKLQDFIMKHYETSFSGLNLLLPHALNMCSHNLTHAVELYSPDMFLTASRVFIVFEPLLHWIIHWFSQQLASNFISCSWNHKWVNYMINYHIYHHTIDL